ncbi:GIY-YIG nuclease family protein [Mycolicibacterium sp. GCM10028919]|uniref:GIY-YIG nuclease family protein n=1 Tax=Mycolicibacterium sp. GCM10028919 TaxID=3273401 RepID=UPI00360FABD6
MSNRPQTATVADFLAARPVTRAEVFAEPCPVPEAPGAYGWWFRDVPGSIDTSGCQQRDGLTLLYVGISQGPPPANGKPRSKQDLRKRIRYHFGGGNANAEGSTLRKTLGLLLAEDLGIELRRIGSGERMTFAGGESVLSTWMDENALVSWVVHAEPWKLEAELMRTLDVPFNIRGNEGNAFHPELKRIRREGAARANKQRILKEW